MSDAVSPGSMAAALAERAVRTPDRTAYIFLAEGEKEQERLTFADLDARARAIAADLSRSVGRGERALLLYPPGLDFVAAFFGCLYAGVIAVPAYPPRSPRMMPRLLSILADARPAVALAAGPSLQRVRGWLERTPEASALSWLATDELDPFSVGWEPHAFNGHAVAFLQYTSGSTATPKGVMVTHANLVHNQRVIQEACGHSEESVFVSWLPLYHDLGLIGNLLQATWVGAPCVLMAPVAFLQNPARWLRAVSRYRGTTSGGPNFAYDLCARRVPPAEVEKLDLSCWQVAFNGAEPVREETLARFAAAFAPAGFRPGAFYPCYGLAEATLIVSGGRPGEGAVVREVGERRLVSCGRALLDLEVAIVDPELGLPRPPGAVGEVWVAGDSVARGYWNRPEETADVFGAALADGRGPWLRTGDLGALAGSELFVAGRLKDLIILRGRNHYPQDLEATAGRAHPALGDGTGAAFAVEAGGEERLVIVHEVERHAARPPEIAAAVRQAIAEEHEVLTYEVVLVPAGGVPRTTSGKVQRRACRDLYLQGGLRVLGASRLSPAAADEDPSAEARPGSLDWLRRAFAAAARVDPGQVDPDRPLSASGLDSLAAVELKHSVEEATGVSIPLPDLLEGMTLREVERRTAGGASAVVARAVPGTGAAAGEHPLSWNQRSLWFLHRLVPESPAYNIAGAARLHGADAAALCRALQGLVDRHPMLRATFADTPDGPVQRVAERAEPAFVAVDAAGWSDVEVRARLHAEAFRPFDLAAGPLLRTALLQRDGESFLVLAVHHIAADFWSMTVLARELGALAGGEIPPPPVAMYTDFVRWQQRLLESPAGERLWEHWRQRLEGTPQLDLPTDRPRRPVQTLRGGSRMAPLSPELAEAVHRLAAAHGCTPFVALLAAWQAVLSRWSGQDELLVGAPMTGRSAREWGDVVGYFVNPVPLRADLTGDPTVRELMARARSTTLDALAHQQLPFALLAERLQPERDPSRPPLVAAMLTFEKAPAPELAPLAAFALAVPGVRLNLGGISLESLPLDPPAAQLDLSLLAAELPGGLAVLLQWDADLFDATTAGRMLGHLDRLLVGMAEAPERRAGEIDLLTPAEQAQLAAAGIATAYPREATIHALFEEQAARAPDRVAVTGDDGLALTYAELNARANQLAHHLAAIGIVPEAPVGIALERSPEMLVAVLGVLKAGGAYVPLDPGYPPDRLAAMMEEVHLPLLMSEERFLRALPGRMPEVLLLDRDRESIRLRSRMDLAGWSDPSALVYVMFTSGSTGRPKAVGVGHRAVVRLVRDTNYAELGPEQVFLQLAPASFDAATLEIWAPLLNGGRLALFPPGPAAPADLGKVIARHGVTTLWLTAGLFHEVVDGGLEALRPLRQLLAGGDALSPEHVNRVLAELPACALINGYGPTENTTFTCCHPVCEPVPPGGSVPIGRPIANTRVHVLDAWFQKVPPGVPAELFTGGDGLARGYLGRPDLTAERFVPSPFAPGERLYRTGDRVRLRPDGAVEFLGRFDQQVKIRGFRVEPGEVESALAEIPGVASAAVLAEGAGAGRRLVAFVVPADAGAEPANPGAAPTTRWLSERLREELRDRLPSFMVPARFAVVEALPLSSNGKVDRRALADLLRNTPRIAVGFEDLAFEPPQGPMEERLAGIWSSLLGCERIGRGDEFFALGGHSLLAVRLTVRVRDAFGIELPLARIFERTTLAEMAAQIQIEAERARSTGAAGEAPPLLPGPRPDEIPLSFAQERLWFLDRLAPGQPVYNVPMALRLRGPVSPPSLTASLAAVAERHEALRAVFSEASGRPVQEISPVPRFPLTVVDLSGLSPAVRSAELARQAGEEARHPFDLASGPLCRATLLGLDREEHLLLLDVHHIVFDGVSRDILLHEWGLLYIAAMTGELPALPPLPVQYADFVLWQRKCLDSGALAPQLDFWRKRLSGTPVALDLPADRPYPPAQTFRGGAEPMILPLDLVRELRAVGRSGGASLFMTLLAGWSTLLYRLSGAPDLLVGTPVANRRQPELGGLIGLFVNTLPLRIDLDGDPPFAELLGRVREAALAAYENQDVPFERLVEVAGAGRDLARNPLFQVMIALAESAPPCLHLPGVNSEEVPIHNGTAKLELLLTLTGADGDLSGGLEFNADLFDAVTARRLADQLSRLLAGVAAWPELRIGDLPLLAPAERHQLFVEWRGSTDPSPHETTVQKLFEEQAARTPAKVAAVCRNESVTYQKLDEHAGRLARLLLNLEKFPGGLIGLMVESDHTLLVGILGILKAGSAFVPLAEGSPAERLERMITDCDIRILTTGRRYLALMVEITRRCPTVTHLICLDGDLDPELEQEGFCFYGPRDLESFEPSAAEVRGDGTVYVIFTSGSTGVPKGVPITHKNLVPLLLWSQEAFGFGEHTRVLQTLSYTFDFGVFEILTTLLFGGTLFLQGESERSDVKGYLQQAQRHAINSLHATPSFFRAVAAEAEAAGERLSTLEVLHLGGEALSEQLVEAAFAVTGEECRLFNGYGPTEAAVNCALFGAGRVSEWRPLGLASVPIGRPSAANQLFVLDERMQPLPIGMAGELFIGGVGLSCGYLRQPELTACRFVPDLFGLSFGGRLYRTGDLSRWRSDGALEFLGRIDQQVKIRGFRIELGEIETALLSHPQIQQAVVVTTEIAEMTALVAYIVSEETRPSAAELREFLRRRLPEQMVPALLVMLETLPLTRNGKVDRKALPVPDRGLLPTVQEPRTPVEEVLAGIWSEMLGLEQVGLHESFFELGGHSLLATRVISRLSSVFSVELPLRTLFERPTVAELATVVEAARRGGTERAAPPLLPVPHGFDLPLSFAQERLWFLDRLAPGQATYNVPLALRLRGPVSASSLTAALAAVARRHEVLCASFPEASGRPAQTISAELRPPLTLVDLTGLPAAVRPAEAALQANEEARRPFDLAAGPLCRAALLRLDREEHFLVLDIHHIVFDGWSEEILLRELGLLYDGKPLPPPPVQYADFVLWQRTWLDGGALAAQLDSWRERLAGAPGALDLPTDRRRPPVQTFRGGAEPVALSAELVRDLRSLGRRHGATLFMTVLAGWSALLHRSSGAPEVVVGSPVANRQRPELEGLIGLFVNTLPLRIDLTGDPPFVELIDRVRATALAAYDNQDVPFERLVEALGTERDLSRSPLFQAMLALADSAAPTLRLPGVTADQVPIHNGTAKFELLLALHKTRPGIYGDPSGGLSGGLEFNADLYDAATARRLVDRFGRLLAGVAVAPHLRIGDLPLLAAAEERQILMDWNATEAPFPRDLGLHELFETQAARTPQATALIHGERRVTYAELDAWADLLALRLRSLGVGPEVLVGVFCGRTPGMVAAVLAVLKAGGAYLPLDPAYPVDRLAFLLADSGAPVVLLEKEMAAALPASSGPRVLVDRDPGGDAARPEVGRPRGFVHPEQAAYAIYTSGSTGMPKGVIVRHASAVNRIAWAVSAYAPAVLAGVLASTSLCFDLSVFEIFVPLAAGGAVVLADDALALPDLPAASSVTLVNTVPSAMAELVRAGALPRSVRVVNLAGEPLRRDLAARIYAQEGIEEVHNLYGPSEDTTYSTGTQVERTDEREPAIGQPLPNTQVYLLDPRLRPAPVGAPGELWIGGAGVARGYLSRPDLTADRFRPDPFGPSSGGRLYRTGDLGRRRADGTIDYLGRLDHQVKVRGFRIELGEIEAALLAHSGVREAAVLALTSGDGKRLVACVAPETVPAGDLRQGLAARLPGFMVPSSFLSLASLPLTPNGKVDRCALERLAPGAAREARGEYVAPRNAVEEILAPLWAEVLEVERVGALDDFFALGGNSLAGVRLVARVRELSGVQLPVRELFQAPTLAAMAERLAAEMAALAGDDLLDDIDVEALQGG